MTSWWARWKRILCWTGLRDLDERIRTIPTYLHYSRPQPPPPKSCRQKKGSELYLTFLSFIIPAPAMSSWWARCKRILCRTDIRDLDERICTISTYVHQYSRPEPPLRKLCCKNRAYHIWPFSYTIPAGVPETIGTCTRTTRQSFPWFLPIMWQYIVFHHVLHTKPRTYSICSMSHTNYITVRESYTLPDTLVARTVHKTLPFASTQVSHTPRQLYARMQYKTHFEVCNHVNTSARNDHDYGTYA